MSDVSQARLVEDDLSQAPCVAHDQEGHAAQSPQAVQPASHNHALAHVGRQVHGPDPLHDDTSRTPPLVYADEGALVVPPHFAAASWTRPPSWGSVTGASRRGLVSGRSKQRRRCSPRSGGSSSSANDAASQPTAALCSHERGRLLVSVFALAQV